MKSFLYEIDGRQVEVLAEKIAGRLWLHYNGKTIDFAPELESWSGSAQASLDDPTQIVAPMPGKIMKLFKNVGDTVVEGDTVVAMEAMKMEYNLKATQKMRIQEVLCQENQTVGLGDLLVQLEGVNE